MDFSTLTLNGDLKKGLAEAGFISAMPVQEQVIANAFSGRDLYVQSQTGTGKTLAYLMVIMQRLIAEPALTGRKALIMVPTRELAVQVEDEAKLLGKYLPFKTGAFYGGVGYGSQQQMLRDDAQILIGTPGRVLDLNASGHMNLMSIAFLVLDEADRMFDMGFYPDLRKLVKVVPPADRRQTMLFSATLNTYVKNLAYEYTKEPVEIEIEPENITVTEIEQLLYHVPSANKMKLLLGILRREDPESAIIFCNTKRYTEVVAKRLKENGIKCEFISGDLPQQKRLSVIDNFKAGKIRFLVATDVAARGLDIEALALVVNFDLPAETENYVHRIGRTARAGKSGKAVSFASEQDVYELSSIEKYLGNKIPAQIASEDLYGEDVGGRKPPLHRQDASPQRHEQPRQRKSPHKDEKRAARFSPSRSGGNVEDSALLGMSLDERMAYYKRKYASGKPEETGVHTAIAGDAGKSAGHSKRRKRRKPDSSSVEISRQPVSVPPAAKTPGTEAKSTNKRRHHRPAKDGVKPPVNYAGKSNTQNSQPKPQSETPKKDLLSRLFGVFKKKD
ncbi:MAG: DEAD/DEAH box helicase [Treponema sp.]|jgi:ATP-dependent RNA helicase RhlB|nr:DEAD/DEAH box helicase [Treponema sp.]